MDEILSIVDETFKPLDIDLVSKENYLVTLEDVDAVTQAPSSVLRVGGLKAEMSPTDPLLGRNQLILPSWTPPSERPKRGDSLRSPPCVTTGLRLDFLRLLRPLLGELGLDDVQEGLPLVLLGGALSLLVLLAHLDLEEIRGEDAPLVRAVAHRARDLDELLVRDGVQAERPLDDVRVLLHDLGLALAPRATIGLDRLADLLGLILGQARQDLLDVDVEGLDTLVGHAILQRKKKPTTEITPSRQASGHNQRLEPAPQRM